jgi:ABC-2 type transport system permease protein
MALITGIALIAGMDVLGDGADLVGLYLLAFIVNIAGTLFSAGVALRFRSLQATPLMMVPTFLFLFVAPVYVPRDLLGGWVHAVSAFDPATPIIGAIRDLLAGQPADFLLALGIALALAAALAVFAVRGLRKAEAAG